MNDLIPLHFDRFNVRMIMLSGVPWWVTIDVCAVLGIKNHRSAVSRLDDYQKGVAISDSLGGRQEFLIVNEAGIYALTLKSRKPEARAFARWLFTEVLPSIRQHGMYPPPPLDNLALLAAISEDMPEAEWVSEKGTMGVRFLEECASMSERADGFESPKEIALNFMSASALKSMQRGDGGVWKVFANRQKLEALVANEFDLKYIIQGIRSENKKGLELLDRASKFAVKQRLLSDSATR